VDDPAKTAKRHRGKNPGVGHLQLIKKLPFFQNQLNLFISAHIHLWDQLVSGKHVKYRAQKLSEITLNFLISIS
jgi:hypothetical protein